MSMLPEVPAERGMTEVSPEAIVIVSLKGTQLHGSPFPSGSPVGSPAAGRRSLHLAGPAGLPTSTR